MEWAPVEGHRRIPGTDGLLVEGDRRSQGTDDLLVEGHRRSQDPARLKGPSWGVEAHQFEWSDPARLGRDRSCRAAFKMLPEFRNGNQRPFSPGHTLQAGHTF